MGFTLILRQANFDRLCLSWVISWQTMFVWGCLFWLAKRNAGADLVIEEEAALTWGRGGFARHDLCLL
jgi:hypothetical protein